MNEPAPRPSAESNTTEASNEHDDGEHNAGIAHEETNAAKSRDEDHERLWRKLSSGRRVPTPIRQYARRRHGLIVARLTLSYWRSKDPEDNKATALPSDEHICAPVVWATELYTPTTFAGLSNGLPKLLAKSDDRYRAESIIAWLQSARRHGHGAWRMLPPILPQPGVVYGAIIDVLPRGIESAEVSIYMLTSTVAAVTTRFRLKDERSRELEAILNSDLTTQAEVHSDGSSSIKDVASQKQAAVDAWHADVQADATSWLADRLPGSFAGLGSAKLPIVELLLTEQLEPWQHTAPENQGEVRWTSLLDLNDSDVLGFWQCIDMPWLRLRERVAHGWIPNRLHIVTMAAKRADLLAAFPSPSSGTAEQALNQALHFLALYAVPLVNRWALTALVSELEDELKATRDLARRSTTEARSGDELDDLQQHFLHFGVDGQIALSDVVQFAENERAWKREFPDFAEVVQPFIAEQVPARQSLAETMRKDQIDRGKSVVKSGADLQNVLSASVELTATAENLRLQKRLWWLTVAAFVVAVIAGAATVATFYISIKSTTVQPSVRHTSTPVHRPSHGPRASKPPVKGG